MKVLIVNADDFGRTAAINRGVLQAYDHGIVTSASLMVRGACAVEAVAEARQRPALGLGLHLDLGEWLYRDGAWEQLYAVTKLDDKDAIEAELERQVARFFELVDRAPTHLDSHQHIHLQEPVRAVATALAARLAVPLRRSSGGVAYCGDFYGQDGHGQAYPGAITPGALIRIIRGLSDGVTELICHPGIGERRSSYGIERDAETATLCAPEVRRAAVDAGIQLRSFADLRPRAERG